MSSGPPTLTAQDMARLAERMEAAWPGHPFDERRRRIYYEALADLPQAAVEAAVEALLREDRDRQPPPGVIRARALTPDASVLAALAPTHAAEPSAPAPEAAAPEPAPTPASAPEAPAPEPSAPEVPSPPPAPAPASAPEHPASEPAPTSAPPRSAPAPWPPISTFDLRASGQAAAPQAARLWHQRLADWRLLVAAGAVLAGVIALVLLLPLGDDDGESARPARAAERGGQPASVSGSGPVDPSSGSALERRMIARIPKALDAFCPDRVSGATLCSIYFRDGTFVDYEVRISDGRWRAERVDLD